MEHRYQIMSFQCSRSLATTSRALISKSTLSSYQWLLPVAFLRVFPGWTQVDSYRNGRSSRAERGVRAYSPAWSERPTPSRDTSSVSYEKAPRFPKGKRRNRYPVNGRVGTGERTREPPGGNAWYLYSPVGFRHH